VYALQRKEGGASVNYYERHIGDYLKDTAHLSLLEHGVYGRLLDLYYTREQPIPEEQVMRLVGARSDEDKFAVRDVLNEFFTRDGDVWRHARCDRELERYRGKQEKAKASAHARWNKPSNADAMRTHSEGTADGMLPVTSNQTPDTIVDTQPAAVVETPRVSPDEPKAKTISLKTLVAEGVDPQHAQDWLTIRRQKKAPLTATAWDSIKREASAARITPAEAVKIAAENGWQGFKASWLERVAAQPTEARQVEARATVAVEKTEAYLAEQQQHAEAARSEASRKAARAALEALGRKLKA
jgi:uncharacterized protein YdaU (DUF1376 family)